jgi:SAM-dependent methyltransferase
LNDETKNPWLQISAEDYEGHMSAPNVAQLEMLNTILANVLNEFSPKSICILGCTTGNGFEHILNRNVNRVVGVDINPEYVAICKNRFEKKIPLLELVIADLNEADFPDSSFDLIHAALVFEYVEVELLLSKISRWLKHKGILSVVLQQPSENAAAVSETPYQSIKVLVPFIKLIETGELKETAKKSGLYMIDENEIVLKTGKRFINAYFKKEKPV